MAPARARAQAAPSLSRATAFLRGCSVEVTAHDRHAEATCREHLPQGTSVYIAFVAGISHHRIVQTAAALQRAGFVPVPHIVARNMTSYTQLRDLLARLAGEAGVTAALAIGGDSERPAGPFASSLQMLETGLFQRHGIERIGLACFPEAHQRIPEQVLSAALADKLARVRADGMEAWLVTQFCFEPEPIVRRIAALRAAGVAAPVRVGLAGPADRRTLWKYALHCGIGNSMRALGTHVDAIANLLSRDTPDAVLNGVAEAADADPRLGIEGIHVFTFGGVANTAKWIGATLGAG